MQQTDTSSRVIRHALHVLRRRLLVIATFLLIAVGVAYALSASQTKEYTASASLLFNNQSAVQQVSGTTGPVSNDPTGQRATNLLLVSLSDQAAAQAAARSLNGTVSAAKIRSSITATQAGQSNIVTIAATSTSPALAAKIANAYTSAFIQHERSNDQTTVQNAIALVEQQFNALTQTQQSTPQGQALLDRIESLKIIRSMQHNEQVVRSATAPSAPSSPKTVRNVVLAAVLGLLFGIGLAFVLDGFDQRLREPQEVEEAFALPMLGLIPHGNGRPTRSPVDGWVDGWRVELEPFRMLRAHLRYFNIDRSLRTILVVSPFPSEGKTTVAHGLAAAAASVGTKTLLVEADLRSPVIDRALGLAPSMGLSGALIGSEGFAPAIQRVDLDQNGSNGGSEIRWLDVIPAGPVPPNPAEMLESKAMESGLEWARQNYELVIVDSAPLSVVPDSIPLVSRVDGIIVVSRLGHSRRDAADRLSEQLNSLSAPVLGVVVNDLKSRRGSNYGYGYGYGYGGKYGEVQRLAEAEAASEDSDPAILAE